MPKLGRSLGIAGLPNRVLELYLSGITGPAGNVYIQPSEIGSAVTLQNVGPFAGGGYSYSFIESVDSYLKLNHDQSWSVGSEDFTIEWFSNQTSLTNFPRVFTIDDYPNIDLGVSIESNGDFYFWAGNSASPKYSSLGASTTNTWYHFAVVRSNGITRIYRNGTQLAGNVTDITASYNITNPANLPLVIGNTTTYATNAAFKGYITNFRWVKGLAVYTGDFTVPTSELTLIADANPYGGSNTQAIPAGYTKLLLVPTPAVTSRIITDLDEPIVTDTGSYIIYGT